MDELAQDVGLPIETPTLLACCVPTSPGSDVPCRPSCGPLRLVFASRIEAHKGIDLVLDAVDIVRGRGITDFFIDVFGAGRVAQFRQQTCARDLETIVRYRGSLPKEEMLQRLRDYDALLLPTWEREPFGGVAADAATAGCIPIITATIGAAEWMVDGLDCIKIRRDAADLAAAIIDLAQQAPAQRLALRERVRRNARLTFDFERWFVKLMGLLETVAAARSPPAASPARIVLSLGLLTRIWTDRVAGGTHRETAP